MRGGGGRMGGGLGGSRGGSVRGLGSSSIGGGAGRGGRGAIPTPSANRGGGGFGGGLGGGARRPAPRRGPGFGTGMAMGMGAGMMMGGGRRRRGWGMGGTGWGRRRHMPMGGMGMGAPMGRRGGGCGSGCSSIIMLIIVLILVFSVISWLGNFNSPQNWANQGIQHGAPADPFPQVIPSTIVREPLPAGSAIETGSLFTDRLGWITNQTALTTGMRSFHQATGVRPHLYIVGEIDGNTRPTDQQLMDFAQGLYDQMFDDEAHVLLVFFEDVYPYFGMVVVPGSQARSVMDQEAQDILMDFVTRFYYMDISEEEVFSGAFQSAGERIMYAPPQPPDNRPIWITIIVVAGVLLLVFMLFRWWQRKQEAKAREAEETERLLSQPLETFGSSTSDAANNLAQQYTDNNEDNNNF